MPGKFDDLGTHLDLLEEGDHLGLAESGFLHVETPAGGIPYLRVTPVFEVTSNCACQAIKQKKKKPLQINDLQGFICFGGEGVLRTSREKTGFFQMSHI